MSFAKTPHGKISYNIKGHGPAVVLIRGLGCWSVHWHGWDDMLAKTCTVITFDNKGLGLTTSPMLPWHSVKEIADDIAIILKSERLDSAHIVGTSLGGMIGLKFALEYPAMTQSLSVIGSSVGRSGHMRISLPAIRLLLRSPFMPETYHDELADLLTSPKTSLEKRRKLADDFRSEDKKQKRPIASVLAQLIAALRFNRWERLKHIECPTQIIVGRHDQFVPKGNSLYLHAKLPGSTLVEVPDAGHDPHVDRPELMTKIIADFVAGHDHSART